MLTEDQIPIDALVIDAGPLIRNDFTTSILNRVGKLYSTPAVIAEIRDAATRSRLETTWLPLLTLRAPKPESIKVVGDFAKKTGDFSVLSVTDLQLLALTYELEVELNAGNWRLKSVPGQKKVNGPIPKAVGGDEEKEGEGLVKVDGEKTEDGGDAEPTIGKDTAAAPTEGSLSQKLGHTHISANQATPMTSTESSGSTEQPSSSPPEPTMNEDSNPPPDTNPTENAPTPTFGSATPPSASASEDSDSEGWITPSNLHKHQSKSSSSSPSPSTNPKASWPIRAALATTDFALQSVTLQMNLHLLSTKTLQRIHTIRSHILRCHACFKLTRDMAKQFCPVCGGPTLQRVSCSTDSKGAFKIYLKCNYQWNNRGNVFSLPKPTHGSANGKGDREVLILREDQKEYEREVARGERRKERDLLDPDYLPGILTGERRDTGGRPKIGYGRRNPNVARKGGKKK